jgi:hypothetical protein
MHRIERNAVFGEDRLPLGEVLADFGRAIELAVESHGADL